MNWYYTFLVRRPYLMLLAIAVLCSACIIVSLTLKEPPDFSDPTLGFEARGTDIGNRLIAWHNLAETEASGYIVSNPSDLLGFKDNKNPVTNHRRKHGRNRNRKKYRKNQFKSPTNAGGLNKSYLSSKNYSHPVNGGKDDNRNNLVSDFSPSEWNGDSGIFHDYKITNESVSSTKKSGFEYGHNMSFVDENDHQEKFQTKKRTWQILKQGNDLSENKDLNVAYDGYFCDAPVKEFSHFVVERWTKTSNAHNSLFDLNGLLAMCQLEELITSVKSYGEYCQKEESGNCCRPWSLSNYVSLLSNKSSCFDINQEDVKRINNLLNACYKYFINLKLSNGCNENKHCFAPPECTRYDAVFNILHYLTDFNFIKSNGSNMYLKYAMIFIPVVRSTKILDLFYEWEEIELKNVLVKVVAMDLGLENELFNECLLSDGWLISLGGLFVMTSMWMYTTSIFVTVMTSIAVIFSIGLAYFVYTVLFEMSFFPYMNLLIFVVMIGIGADNVFIFTKIWECALADRFANNSLAVEAENTETLQYLIASTLRHAAVSMLISSLTTAGAFFASYTSSISSIKCFGVFAGTAVIANYFLMITWLPATISIMERFTVCNNCGMLYGRNLISRLSQSINKVCISIQNAIINVIVRYSMIWIILFAVIGVLSGVVALYWPGLQLPVNSHFQLFVNDHPFEVYHSKLKNEFRFERSMTAYENFKLPLRFVWGILPVDDGDFSNPYSYGNLHYDNNFNISTKAAQVWLLNFCQQLKQQSFYQLTLGLLLPNCFIENFISFMNRMCIDSMDGTDRTPCCDISKFPYKSQVFDHCLPESISSLYATPKEFFLPTVAGPKFSSPEANHQIKSVLNEKLYPNVTKTSSPIVKALVIEFESNVSFSTSYNEIKKFVKTVETWFNTQLKNAPDEMHGGWFISELKFFDVQDTLTKGTIVAILVAIGVSLSVLLLVTLNVLISVYAVLTVLFTIITTVAVLIMLGWKLNILESVAVCTAIGLAVDYSLHYSIHYSMSPTQEREAATRYALVRIIGPTGMAALTTGIAGAVMLFSKVLPYIQIGMFLVVVGSVSWIYATFFLMSLLKSIGPQYGFMQFSFLKFTVSKRSGHNGAKLCDRKQSQFIAKEQVRSLSSSVIEGFVNSESHELDSLTSNSLIRTVSRLECSNTSPLEFLYPLDQNQDAKKNILTFSKQKYHQTPSANSAISVDLPANG